MRVDSKLVYPILSTHFIVENTKSLCPTTAKQEPILRLNDFNVTVQNNNSYCSVPFCSNSTANDNGLCDLKVFVSWLGTDKDGTTLTSSSSRWTALQDYNFPGLYDSLINIDMKSNSTDTYVFSINDVKEDKAKDRIMNPPPTNITLITENQPNTTATNKTNATQV